MIEALITRPLEDARRLERQLAERGVAGFNEPMLRIHFPAERLKILKERLEIRLQAILITSANGARALARAGEKRDFPLITVGEGSAEEARNLGFSAVASAGGDVRTLAEETSRRCRPEQGPLLHIAGSVTAGDLPGSLISLGFQVERCVAYESVAADAFSEALRQRLMQRPFDLALFYSPRSSAVFAALAAREGLTAPFRDTQALALSQAAADELASIPFRAVHCAQQPSGPSMLALIERIYGCSMKEHHG